MHKLVIKEIGKNLRKDVLVQIVGNRSTVERFFEYSQDQGGWEHGLFLVDLDDRLSHHSSEQGFVQLNKYCMENYFLNPRVCAAVLGGTEEEAFESICRIAIDRRGAIAHDKRRMNYFFDKLEIDGDLDTFLSYVDAKKILKQMREASGIDLDVFVREYVTYCHTNSLMKQVLPTQVVELINDLPDHE